MISKKFGSRLGKLEELLKDDKSFDRTIKSLALDIVLRTSETELLRTLASDYKSESNDTVLKETNTKIKHYQRLINKHIKENIVRDVYLKKINSVSISNQEYRDVLNVIESSKQWRIKDKVISSNLNIGRHNEL